MARRDARHKKVSQPSLEPEEAARSEPQNWWTSWATKLMNLLSHRTDFHTWAKFFFKVCFCLFVSVISTLVTIISCWLLSLNKTGLVVKADPGFNSRFLHGHFPRSGHTQWLKIGTPVATLPGAWSYMVSAGTRVWTLWMGEKKFYCQLLSEYLTILSVAACTIFYRYSSLRCWHVTETFTNTLWPILWANYEFR